MSFRSHRGRCLWSLAVLVGGVTGASCTDSPTGADRGVVVGVEVVPGADTLVALGSEVRLAAVATNAFGDVVAGKSFIWASSNLLVARVDDDGLVTAVGNGRAVVTATADSVTGGAEITVEQEFFQMVFDPGPTDALTGQPVGTVRVRAEDAGGSALRNGAGTVTLQATAGSPGRVVGGPLESVMFAGEATFADVTVEGTGLSYRLEATWQGESSVSLPFDIVTAFDAVQIINMPDPTVDELGLLVDGLRAGQPLNDFPVTTLVSVAEVGVVRSAGAGGNDEVVVFSPDRRPALARRVPWSSGVDTVDVALEASLEMDLTIWIVKGPFGAQANHASLGVSRTQTIWDAERAGIRFDSVAYIDATAADSASNYHDLTLCDSRAGLERDIGYVAGTINIYWVGTVDSGTRRGRACPIGGEHIIMAEDTGDELLSHEIGHSLSLRHTDAITERFDQTNVMHSASSVRRYLTEGQVFRQQLNPGSVVNGRWGLRTGEQRNCPRDTESDSCPAIEARIWADGGFGPTLVAPAGAGPGSLTVSNAVRQSDGTGRGGANATGGPAQRWMDVQCEMEDNEGLSAAVLRMGAVAVETFVAEAMRAVPAGPIGPEARGRRIAALDGLVLMANRGGRGALARIVREGPSDMRAAAAARLESLERSRR